MKNQEMAVTIQILHLLLCVLITYSSTCPPDWYPSSRGTCYRSFESQQRLNGFGYTQLCKAKGGYPATLYNADDKTNGIAHFPETFKSPYMYIGLTDYALECEWLWMDGTELTAYVDMAFNKQKGQPNGWRSQNCIAVDEAFKLYDYPCCDFSGWPDVHLCLCEKGNSSSVDVNRLIQECPSGTPLTNNKKSMNGCPRRSTSATTPTSAPTTPRDLSTPEAVTSKTAQQYVSVSSCWPIIKSTRCHERETGSGNPSNILSMIDSLRINKNSTYAYKRRFNSAQDNRQSAMIIGFLSVAVLVAELFCFVAPIKIKPENSVSRRERQKQVQAIQMSRNVGIQNASAATVPFCGDPQNVGVS